MDVQITHEGSDITNSVIEYTREQSICSGIGTLMLTVARSAAPTISVGDDIKLYEGGVQKGKYRVNQPTKDNKGNLTVNCQDFSWKLTDYFITDVYYIDYPTYTRTWIEKFLNEVGLSYQFKDGVGNGTLVNQNSSLGMSSAYDAVMTLLQQSAWYMYFDNDGKCRIGDLQKDFGTPNLRVDEGDITNIYHVTSDKSLRNRAVVWGNANVDKAWVLADVYRDTPWDRDSRDIRTILFASSYVNSVSAAYDICYKLLDEFAVLNDEKTVTLAGAYNVDIGNVVKVTSRAWTGKGLVTTIRSTVSSKGLLTILVLDEKCPRLLGYYGFTDWLYTAHNGAGVWRKEFTGTTWESFSNGIDAGDMQVTDLIVKSEVFACVANGYLYYRNSNEASATWNKFTPPYLPDQSGAQFDPTAVTCVAVDIDTYSHNIYAGYKLTDLSEQFLGYQRCWVVQINPLGTVLSYEQVFFTDVVGTDYENFKGVDLAKYDNGSRLPTAIAPASYSLYSNPGGLFGSRQNLYTPFPDPLSFCFGPLANDEKDGGVFEQIDRCSMGGNIVWRGGLAISINSFDQFSIFNYTKYGTGVPEDEYSMTTGYTLPDFPDYYPNNNVHAGSRYTFWDGNTNPDESEINVIDWTYIEQPDFHLARQYSAYFINLSGLQDWENQKYEAVGYTSTEAVTASGVQIIDGHITQNGDVVFLKDQENPVDNGMWVANGTGAWARDWSWTPTSGLLIQPIVGLRNCYHCFQLVPDYDDLVLGTTPMTFKEVLKVKDTTVSLVADASAETGGINGVTIWDGWNMYDPRALHDSLMTILKVPSMVAIGDSTGSVDYYGITLTPGGGVSRSLIEHFIVSDIQDSTKSRTYSELGLLPAGQGVAILGARLVGNSHLLVKHIHEPGGDRAESALIFSTPASQTSACCASADTEQTSSYLYAHLEATGYYFMGEQNDTYFRAKFDGNTYYNKPECADHKCPGMGGMYTRRGAFVHGSIYGGSLNIESKGTEWIEGTGITCENFECWCCGSSSLMGSVDFSGDVTGSKVPLTSRWRPTYLYNGIELRDAMTDAPYYTLEHPTDVYGICLQMDDFDGGIYICKADGGDGHTYKEIPGIGTVAIISGHDGANNGLVFAHGCLMGWKGDNTSLRALDKEHILNGATLCYLLQEKRDVWGDETGTFIIRDFDFYGFNTEDSKPEPLISWTFPPSLVTYTFSGISYSGWWYENMKVHKTLNFFKGVPISGQFNDGRTFTYLGTTTSGIDIPYGTHALMATRENHLDIVPTASVSGLSLFVVTSGVTFSVETTNYGTDPYIFYGVTPAGFWQKDAYESEYVNYPGHPISDFLSIRADDSV